MPVRWGLLSTAQINEALIAAAAESDRAEIVAVASRDEARADAYAREHAIPRSRGSYEALLADDDVDAVYVSVPNSLHVEWTIRALEAGKHVLCEKPFSRRAAAVERAFDVAEANGLVLSEGFMWRHAPAARELSRLVAEGALGRVRVVRAQFSFQLEASRGSDDTRFRADLDGGALMDLGCYCISAIRLALGEPATLQGRQVVGPTGVDVVFSAVLGYDGAVGHFDCGFVLPSRRELELVGEEATLVVRGEWPGGVPSLTIDGEPIEVETANPYRCELDNVSAAIRGEAELLLGREDAVAQARAIEALYASAS